MSGAPSSGFDPSPWIAANAALAARIGAGGARSASGLSGGLGLMEIASASNVVSFQGQTITGDRDEERRRRLPGIATRGGRREEGASLPLSGIVSGFAGNSGASGMMSSDGTDAASISTASLLARGYQPAVVKVVSYAHGVTRATASAQYVERDEVELETHGGVRLADKEAVAEEIKAWSLSFEKRNPSQDVVAVRVQLSGLRDTTEDRERLGSAVAAAFDGHRHAVRIDAQRDGILEARVVTVMARIVSPEEKAIGRAVGDDSIKRPALPSRIRVVGQRMGSTDDAPVRKVFDVRSEAAMKARIEVATGYPQHGISIEPATPGHGRDAVGQRLATLVSKGPARSHEGKQVRNAEDIREVTRNWGRHLRSQSPRDTMHMVVSAKAGADVRAFTNAVRSFLHGRFSDHKFMFAVHTDKAEAGHIHAHAIVAVRSEAGTKLHPGPSDLAQWRVSYAAHAREHGLQVVATRAAEQASSRSYGTKDKSIVDVAMTPRPERRERDRAYSTDPRNANLIANARLRMETARANPVRIPETDRERIGVKESLAHWRAEVKARPENDLAGTMVQRLTAASEAGAALCTLKQASSAQDDSKSQHDQVPNEPPAMTHQPKSASYMLQDLRILNQKAADVAALLPEGSRARFAQRAATYLEKIAERVDQQRAQEAKALTQRTTNERQAMVSVIRKAEQVARVEAQEARQAEKAVGRAVEAERRIEGTPLSDSGSMAAIDQKRALVREAETSAETESGEAREATDAARLIANHLTKPVPTATSAPGDRVAEIRCKQAEMLERLSKERAQAMEKGHELGD